MDNPIRQKCQEMLRILDEIKKARDVRDAKVGNVSNAVQNINSGFAKIESLNSEIFNLINGKAVVVKENEIKKVVQQKVNTPAKPVPFKKLEIPAPKISAPIAPASAAPAALPVQKPEDEKKETEIPVATSAAKPLILAPELASQKFKKLSDKQKEKYIQDLSINYEELQEFIKDEKVKNFAVGGEIKREDYTIYSPKDEAVIANKYAKKYADRLIKDYPELFKPLFTQYKKVSMNYLSRSWVSMMLFYSVLALPGSLIFLLILKLLFKGAFEIGFGIIILGTFLIPIAVLVGLYFYPGSLIEDRGAKIRNELPFALIHMSSVAGSGAHPISIFQLLTESNEYPELKVEIKKVLNYVNLFGYNLSTALKNTAATTPSQELKELLNGMVSTIETGGDLKGYLKGKSEDSLNNYRLERKKEVEALGTYSEIYTSILIAAPLLLVVTLAIMNSITSTIAGMSIITLSYLGVGLGLPLLNIGFIIFLKSQVANI